MEIKEILKRVKNHNFSYINPKLELRVSFIQGRGVFAKKPIRKGEIVTVCGGIIINAEECRELSRKRKEIYKHYLFQIEDDFYMLSAFKKDDLEVSDYINHSCSPNAGFRGQIIMVAMQNIKPGEEVTYDYAMTDSDPDDYFKCNCGAKNCRKVVTGSDWKVPSLQRKYRNYFSFYIQEKIKKLKKKRKF